MTTKKYVIILRNGDRHSLCLKCFAHMKNVPLDGVQIHKSTSQIILPEKKNRDPRPQ